MQKQLESVVKLAFQTRIWSPSNSKEKSMPIKTEENIIAFEGNGGRWNAEFADSQLQLQLSWLQKNNIQTFVATKSINLSFRIAFQGNGMQNLQILNCSCSQLGSNRLLLLPLSRLTHHSPQSFESKIWSFEEKNYPPFCKNIWKQHSNTWNVWKHLLPLSQLTQQIFGINQM